MKKLMILLLFVPLFVACDDADDATASDELVDTVAQPLATDTVTTQNTEPVDTATVATDGTGVVTQEEAAAMDAEYAVEIPEDALDFCECVKRQKALSDELMETDDDARMDEILAETEQLREKCPDLSNPGAQMSVEAREAYERKVKRCM